MTVNSKALRDLFVYRATNRGDGSSAWFLRDDAPEWARDFAREAHGTDLLPDDQRYALVVEALDKLREYAEHDPAADPDDIAHEFADEVDVYTTDLTAWLDSRGAFLGYVDRASEAGLTEPDAPIDSRLMAGQYVERLEVFGQVVTAAERYGEDDES